MPRYVIVDNGPLAGAVRDLIKASSIISYVQFDIFEQIIGGPRRLVITDHSRHVWGTDEEVLWSFLRSLSGAGAVDLHALSSCREITSEIMECLKVLFENSEP